jgi:hypothetical protein
MRILGTLVGALAAALIVAVPAGATVTGPTRVTGPSPFAVGCAGPGHDPTGTLFEDGEVEPWVAVDQTDPLNVAGSWQQDRWSDGGSHGLAASSSTDGGTTWDGTTFADFSRCPLFAHYGDPDHDSPGKEFDRGSDPWVSWGSGSRLHQIALTVSQPAFGLGLNAGILVSHSDDFGATWSHPQTLKEDHGGNVLDDKESITADPQTGHVYAIWDRLVSPSEHASLAAVENGIGYRGPTWFASSSDNGDTWSAARKIYDPGEINQTISNQIAVMPDGSLVDAFLLIHNFKNNQKSRGYNVAIMRSHDFGATWSQPVIVSKLVRATVRTPSDNLPLRTGDIIVDLAVDHATGAIYVAWQDARDGTPAIWMSKSITGGDQWSDPQKVSDSPTGVAAFTGSVDVDNSGDVGVTFYDFRRDTATTATALTDYWIRTSTNGGDDWTTQRLTTGDPFDMKKAPIARGFFTGDYEGLDHAGDTFKAFFVQTNAAAGNPTDVWAAGATAP